MLLGLDIDVEIHLQTSQVDACIVVVQAYKWHIYLQTQLLNYKNNQILLIEYGSFGCMNS